jgi:hypothetical protein
MTVKMTTDSNNSIIVRRKQDAGGEDNKILAKEEGWTGERSENSGEKSRCPL